MSGLSGLCLALAFLTKSFHAATIFISTALYVFVTRSRHKTSKKQYISYFICLIVPVLLWAVARYANDGIVFLKEMLFYDVFVRAGTVVEGHTGRPYFYVKSILSAMVYAFASCFIAMIVWALSERKKVKDIICSLKHLPENIGNISDDIIGLVIFILCPLLMFSLSASKLDWYLFPQLILLSILGGIIYASFFYSNKRIVKILCYACLMIPMISIAKNVDYVHHADELSRTQQKSQCFLVDTLSRTKEWRDKNIYIELSENDGFQSSSHQELYLICELYGDLRFHTGGVQAFAEDSSADYVMVDKPAFEHYREQLKDAEVSVNNEEFYILSKRK